MVLEHTRDKLGNTLLLSTLIIIIMLFILGCCSAARDVKGNIAYGIKSVQSSLRKGVTGIVLIDGSVQPIDSLCHIPGVCEEKNIPYIYVTCNTDLAGGKITRSHIMLIKPNSEYQEAYDKVLEDIKNTPLEY
ncbi:Ribosomal protein L7Ae/L30e/S12e/Gadd45 [Trinorchestia longiramus]|nr:Ribosomal protein L7Ae/L30e/S12e/Gadd45 [Trinorchestia longiramus]